MKGRLPKLHGTWVRHKETNEEGRIAYRDSETKLVWVVWGIAQGASGCLVKDLVKLNQWEPTPWYR